MKNKEYYKNKLYEIACAHDVFAVDSETHKPRACKDTECDECLFGQTELRCTDVFKEWLEREHIEPILTDEEKQYLEAVISPFKERVKTVTKYPLVDNYAWLYLDVADLLVSICDSFSLPMFRKNDACLGMEYEKEYTLKDLGLFEDE